MVDPPMRPCSARMSSAPEVLSIVVFISLFRLKCGDMANRLAISRTALFQLANESIAGFVVSQMPLWPGPVGLNKYDVQISDLRSKFPSRPTMLTSQWATERIEQTEIGILWLPEVRSLCRITA